MSPLAAVQLQENATAYGISMPAPDLRERLPARENIFQILFPKGGRTLGLPQGLKDDAFWGMAGFEKDVQLTDDFYSLRDTRGELDGGNVELWVNERKPWDILSRLATPIKDSGWAKGNIGIVGADTISEFNQKFSELREQNITIPIDEVMDTDLSRGALALLVPESFRLQSMADLQGVDISTKYPNLAKSFRRQVERDYDIQMGFIQEAKGGTEDDILLDPNVNAIIDFVQSGKSAVQRGLRVAFMDEAKWDRIKRGEARFDDMPLEEMETMQGRGVLATSSGHLVRPRIQFTDGQERVGQVFERRVAEAIRAAGRNPEMLAQEATRPGPSAYLRRKPVPQVEVGHGFRNRY